MELTLIERATIESVINSDYYEGRGTNVWLNTIEHTDYPQKQIFGCVPRLVEKGVLYMAGDGKDATIGITEKGYDAYYGK